MAQAPVFITVPVVAVDRNGSASGTTANLNTALIQSYTAASAGEIAAFPSALSQIIYIEDVQAASTRTKEILSSSTPAQIAALIVAANAGVVGLGTSGQTTLVSGTKAITIAGLTSSNLGFISLVASNTGSSTVTYQAVCTTNTLTLRANVAAGTINVADVSTVNYAILG